MCGIAGAFGPKIGEQIPVREGVYRMVKNQYHRGPDAEGWLQKEHVILGHCRLSIVDLTDAGRQPMSNEERSIWLVYNGEIYNYQELHNELRSRGHKFISHTDTEVLIHGYEEWGIEGLVQRLRGMFAFALYDFRPQVMYSGNPWGLLFLVRDRFGIKPLYYTFVKERNLLLFASEVRALCRSGLISTEENPLAWLGFLLFGSVPTPWTTIRTIQALPPGHYLIADGSRLHIVQYYDRDGIFLRFTNLSFYSKNDKSTFNRYKSNIRKLLEETVSLHIISDAPLGVFLSGGIDSSALVALAARQKQDLKTLGVVFNEKAFSEEVYQRAVAERFRTDHHSVLVSVKDFQEELEAFFRAMDQPTIDGLNTYFVARAAKQIGLKAVLSGLGGDEIFYGYPTLRKAPFLWRLYKLPTKPREVLIAVASLSVSLRKLKFLRRTYRLAFYLVQRGLFTPREVAEILGTEEREAWQVIEALEPKECPTNPILLQQFFEIRHYLTDQLLKDADVFGMAHSVEIRVPFLDHVLFEYTLKVPLSLKLDKHWPKALLTKVLADLLPQKVIFRPKQGFTFPIEVWLRSNKDILKNCVSGQTSSKVKRVWNEYFAGKAHWSRPWALIVMGYVRRQKGLSAI